MTGVTAQTHALSYLRESLARKGVMTTYEAVRQRQGTRVMAAGINVRPHRPPTKSGEPILFTSIEDETGFLEATVVGQAIVDTTETFLTSSLVLVRGTIQRVGRGAYLKVEKAKPLRMTDFLSEPHESGEAQPTLAAFPPAAHTYPGTRLVASV